jgi:hypothetical protein
MLGLFHTISCGTGHEHAHVRPPNHFKATEKGIVLTRCCISQVLNVFQIQKWGVQIIPTVSKKLACGDTGDGAMAEWASIVDAVITSLKHK